MENRERLKEQKRQHYLKHADFFRHKARVYRKNNIDEVRLKDRIYYKQNSGTIKKRVKIWVKENREARREISWRGNLKRRSYKNHVELTKARRREILDRDNWECKLCGIKVHDRSDGNWNNPKKAHIDHVVPVSRGGTSEIENLRVLCRTCNLTKSSRLDEELKKA